MNKNWGVPVKRESETCSAMSNCLWPHGLYNPWNSPGQNTGVGSLSLLQGIFPTQGSNLGLPHCRQILYQLSHKRSPWILEWVAYRFFSGSSQNRNRTGVSCVAGGFFTHRATRWRGNSASKLGCTGTLPKFSSKACPTDFGLTPVTSTLTWISSLLACSNLASPNNPVSWFSVFEISLFTLCVGVCPAGSISLIDRGDN